ncbi:hypothetical protein EHQ43_15215 [Leptospira bouyouniensis]|uniref:Transposase IS66 central domain-containing protein n=1 Tax=Leptospira bouyouniensis TaxID=2484911 RepID=A0A7I0HN21_9LEPT|nr:hypothetical protein EHQ43_15215 [Leptospira bouyouniensis]
MNLQCDKLLVFLEYLETAFDTNLVENAIRLFDIGRKNSLFSKTSKVAEVGEFSTRSLKQQGQRIFTPI